MPLNLFEQPVHLGLGATAKVEPAFTGPDWYEAYAARHAADGAEGRLVSMFTFTENWDSWEMHPMGEEAVICIEGSITLHQQLPDGKTAQVSLAKGQYTINPAGVWHTADVACAATVMFITAGAGTEHRPR